MFLEDLANSLKAEIRNSEHQDLEFVNLIALIPYSKTTDVTEP